MITDLTDLTPYLVKWRLTATGAAFSTHSSTLQAVVLADGTPAMLKLAHSPNEKLGHQLMHWWDALGAAAVYAHDTDAVVLQRAMGQQSLLEMAQTGQDEQATRIICQVARQLHAPRNKILPQHLPTLDIWFDSLYQCAQAQGGIFTKAADIARHLVSTIQEPTTLHGDLHHNNILDFQHNGWLAIDPHALIGERYFDYAQIFCNEDLGAIALQPLRFTQQIMLTCQIAGLDKQRLLQWIIAYAALSASWFMQDNMQQEAQHPLQVITVAQQQLAGCL